MPINPSRYLVPLVVVGALAAGVLLSGHGEVARPVMNPALFATTLKEAEDVAVPILSSHGYGEDLSVADSQSLRAANQKLGLLRDASPTSIVPFFLGGKIDQVLKNGESAERELRQAITNIDKKSSPDRALAVTEIEAHYLLSLVYFDRRKYDLAFQEADTAAKAIPSSALYLAARASASVQLGRTDEARKDVAAALKLDPANPRARQLNLLLNRV